ncbi:MULTISPECIES: nucleoside deaminase [unclassified Dietzia]|uniref:nucleoside deaminase n=1 Tax=unclassified Dietzia TaxID=2617939 RepID=UPI0015FDA5C2|nr:MULTISPECIES: nucleoside deaminase [unclassified Dietzia]MBB1024352.1 nucleoside deaminase [Dietzia sp. DQ12-76]MBB1026304.1 nucleoside deaminase [Dietzia sp. DQ11-38-2]
MNTTVESRPVGADDLVHLRSCVDLARRALEAGDKPFGSVLVDEAGTVRFEDRNRESSGDATSHPEFAIAKWAAENMQPEERAASVVYTSGEHCAMCSAAHAFVGLGRIVFASSGAQYAGWKADLGMEPGPLSPLGISDVAPGIPVSGPVPALAEEIRVLVEKSVRSGRGENVT